MTFVNGGRCATVTRNNWLLKYIYIKWGFRCLSVWCCVFITYRIVALCVWTSAIGFGFESEGRFVSATFAARTYSRSTRPAVA